MQLPVKTIYTIGRHIPDAVHAVRRAKPIIPWVAVIGVGAVAACLAHSRCQLKRAHEDSKNRLSSKNDELADLRRKMLNLDSAEINIQRTIELLREAKKKDFLRAKAYEAPILYLEGALNSIRETKVEKSSPWDTLRWGGN